MLLGKFSVTGVPLIWIIVGQGPIVLAVGAGWFYLDIFFSRLSFLSPPLGDGPVRLKYSRRAVKPKTSNQPNPVVSGMRTRL